MEFPPPGRVGSDHPETSHHAAEMAAWAALDHRERILLRLLANGDKGATGAEIGVELGISTNIACVRLLELRGDKSAAGLYPRLAVKLAPEYSRALPGQRKGRVHVLNEDGVKAAERIAQRLGPLLKVVE